MSTEKGETEKVEFYEMIDEFGSIKAWKLLLYLARCVI